MKNHSIKTLLVGTTVAAVLGFASLSMAWDSYRGGGMGDGRHMDTDEDRRGYGRHMGYRGTGGEQNLSDEQIAAVEKARREFFESTRKLRDRIYRKRLEIRSELARENPNEKVLIGLQKELSGLEGDFDQARITHQLKMRKLVPDVAEGYRSRGFGPGAGGGNCWR